MGLSKTDLFTPEQNDLARAAKAFGNPARVAILQSILRVQGCINGDLVRELGLAQATISQHLRALKDIGILQGRIEGVSMCYCIDPERWAEIKERFNRLFDQGEKLPSKNCCQSENPCTQPKN